MTEKLVIDFNPSALQLSGPIIQVIVEHMKLDQEEAKSLGLEFPPVRAVNGLIDKGSFFTIINPTIAETYKFRYTGPARVRNGRTYGVVWRICSGHFFPRPKSSRV